MHPTRTHPPPPPQCNNGPNACGDDNPCVEDVKTCQSGIAGGSPFSAVFTCAEDAPLGSLPNGCARAPTTRPPGGGAAAVYEDTKGKRNSSGDPCLIAVVCG